MVQRMAGLTVWSRGWKEGLSYGCDGTSNTWPLPRGRCWGSGLPERVFPEVGNGSCLTQASIQKPEALPRFSIEPGSHEVA